MNAPRKHKTASRLATLILTSSIAALLAAPSAQATNYYWDIDGNVAGAGGATPSGIWSSGGTTWSTDSTGSSATPAYTTLGTDDVFFSAGTNATGAYTVTLTDTQNAKSLTFEDGAATISGAGGIITLGGAGGNITVGSGLTATIGANTTTVVGGTMGLTKLGTGTLTLNGSAVNTFTGGLNVNAGTLVLDYTNLATPTDLLNSGNALTLGGGTLTITGQNVAAATTSQSFASTALGAGVNTINIAKGASATSATLNLGPLTVTPGSVTTFSPTTAWTTTASTTERVFISAGSAGTVPIPGSGTAFVNAGVFHRVVGGAAGTLRLAAVDSTGQLLLKANTTNVTTGMGIDPTGSYQWASSTSLQLSGSSSIYGLLLNGNSDFLTLTVANSGTLTLNSIIQIKSAQGLTIAPGTGTSTVAIGLEKNLVIAMDNISFVGISAPIVDNGLGASAVSVVGTAPTGTTPGTVTFSGANTFSGRLSVLNDQLNIPTINDVSTNGPLGNSALAVILGGGNGVTGTLGFTGANGSSTKPFTLATGGTGAFNLASPNVLTLSGQIDGGGSLSKIGTGTLALTNSNTYSGTTTVSAGTLTLSGANGALALSSSPITLLAGVFNIGDGASTAGTNNNTRVADTQTVTLTNGSLVLKGTAITSTNTTETIGAVTQAGGTGTITVTFGGPNTATLTLASLSHTAGAAVTLVNGTSLGKDTASTASVGRLLLSSTPTLVGTTAATATGINSTNKDTVIVPYLVGETTTTTGGLGTATGTANTFLTYNASTGLRPLNSTDEFRANAYTAGNNVRITAATPASANATINSLVVTSTAASAVSITNGSTLTITSGAVLLTGNGMTITGTAGNTLAFSTAEAMITTISGVTATISAAMSGSGGVTKSGAGTLVLGASNLYSGQTTVNQGTLQIGTGTAGDLGANTSGIALNGGTLSFGRTNAGLTLSNAISGSGGVTQSGTGGTTVLSGPDTYTGATTISAGTLSLTGSLAGTAITTSGTGILNESAAGVISGATSLTQNSSGLTSILAGTNSYTGITTITAGVLELTSAGALPGGIATTGGTGGLTFNGGVLGLGAGDFTRNASATAGAAGAFLFNNNGGWAAYGADRVVNIGGANASVSWSVSTGFNGKTLILGAATATNMVTVTNPLSLTAVTRPLQVVRGTGASPIDGQLSGVVSETTSFAGINVTGNGILALTGASTFTGNVLVNSGVTVIANNLAASGSPSPIGQGLSGLTLAGGTFQYAPVASVGGGAVSINRNFAIIASSSIDASGTGALVFSAPTGNIVSPDVTGTGTWTTTAATITGLSSTTNLAVGMRVIGTGITTQTIASIDSASQVTLSANPTLAGSAAGVSFGIPTARILTLTGTNANANEIAGILQDSSATGAGVLSLTKAGVGNWTLSSANTYTGPTQVSAGKLEISGSISGSTQMNVSGGTLLLSGAGGTNNKLNSTTPATVALNGGALDLSGITTTSLDQTVGTLSLSGTSSLDFGTLLAGNTFRFADSHSQIWTGATLSIYDWTPNNDHLFFATDASGLTPTQLGQITFYGSADNSMPLGTATFIAGGELAAIPEPSSLALVGVVLGLVGYRERRSLFGRKCRQA